jgi:hypothetical protein
MSQNLLIIALIAALFVVAGILSWLLDRVPPLRGQPKGSRPGILLAVLLLSLPSAVWFAFQADYRLALGVGSCAVMCIVSLVRIRR